MSSSDGHFNLWEFFILQFFSLDVYGSDKRPLTTDQLYSQLCHVVDKSRHPAIPVGLLTTEGRNAWGKTYTKLMKGI